MATAIVWNLTSALASYGGVYSGDTVAGASSLVDTGRLVSALATGSVQESQIADTVSGAVLTIAGTLTGARTVTFPDSSLTVAGQNYANVFTAAQTVRVAGGLTVQQASTQDAVALIGRAGGTSSYVASLTPGALTGSITLTLPVSATTLGGLAITQSWTGTNTYTQQIVSSLATGTAPLSIASTTKVTNLYADRAALADTVTTNANLTGVITSVGNATSIASQTGTGTKFVVDTSPTLVTPDIGAATGTSLSVSGQLTSTVATGTSPLVVSSTTVVGNLNVSQLLGKTWAAPGTIGSGTPSTGAFTTISATGQLTSTLATGTAPLVIASTTQVANLYAARAALADSVTANANLTGPITSVGNATSVAAQTGTGTTFVMDTSPTLVTPVIGAATGTSLSVSGQLTSTVATGTAPLVVSSTTNVANLNASSLSGATFAAPGAIGGGTPSTGAFTTIAGTTITATTGFTIGGALLATYADSAVTPVIQAMGTTGSAASIGVARFSSTANQAPVIYLAHSLGTTVGDYTASAASNLLGSLIFMGADGTDLSQSCSISGSVDAGATVSAGVVPGRFRLITNDSSGTATQAMAIDSSQVTIIGNSTSASDATFASGTIRPWLQVVENTSASHGMALTRYRAAATASVLYFGKSRSSTIGTMTVVNANDLLGTIDFQGADGTNFVSAVQQVVTATGTPASTRVGGTWTLKTGTDAAPTVMTTALTADHKQNLVVGNAALATSATDGFLYIPSCAGQPTGVPTAFTGRVAIIYDSTNKKINVYDGGWIKTAALT